MFDELETQLKAEISRATRAKTTKKFMQEYFDQTSEELYAAFVSADTNDVNTLQEIVLLHKNLTAPQLWLESIIDTGKLAEAELAKKN